MSKGAALTLLCLLTQDPTAVRADGPAPIVLTLREAVLMALERAPDAGLAKLAASRAGEAAREARALNRPQVVVGTGLAYNNGFPLSIEGAAPSLFQAGVTQPLLSSKNTNLIREAEEYREGARLGGDAVRNDVTARVAIAYAELHEARKSVRLWGSSVGGLTDALRASEAALEAGRSRPVDVALARTATAAARQQLLVAEENARLSEIELRALTGLDPETPVATEDPRLDTEWLALQPADVYGRAAERHPEILRAESDIRAREFHVEAERGEFRPKVDLVSQYALFSRANNYQDYFNRFTRNNFLVGLSIQVPLFDGERSSARVAQSRQEVQEAHLRLQRLKNELRLGIERASSAIRSARGALELAALETEAARQFLTVQESLMEKGRISARELEESRGALRRKEIAQIEAGKAVFQRQVELLRVAGAIGDCFRK